MNSSVLNLGQITPNNRALRIQARISIEFATSFSPAINISDRSMYIGVEGTSTSSLRSCRWKILSLHRLSTSYSQPESRSMTPVCTLLRQSCQLSSQPTADIMRSVKFGQIGVGAGDLPDG